MHSYELSKVPVKREKSSKQYALELAVNFDFLCLMPKPSPLFAGRTEEVSSLCEALLKKRMHNAIIVGKAGVGKTEIARKAIQMGKKGETFLSVDLSLLQSDCSLVGQFEKRFNDLLTPLSSWNKDNPNKRVSLFIDEIHTLWNLNKHDRIGTVPAGDMLKPYLSDGSVSIIGTTTDDEYEEFIRKDKALLRRISPIFVRELDDEDILFKILKGFCGNELQDDLIRKCIRYSKRIRYLSNPDCSLEIADRVMAKALFNDRLAIDDDLEAVIKAMEEQNYVQL